MKIKSLLFVCCLSLMGSLYAENRHIHPKADVNNAKSATAKNARFPGYCQIEIINSSFDNVTVYGTFDDGTSMAPFNIYSYESPHYISLFYYNYCHRDMYLDIVTFSGYHVYSGYTRTESTVRIVPYLANQVKAEIQTK
jgi:hypothetical protein